MKILMVDDDANICELVKLYLLKAGYEPLIAYNGVKAMQIFNEEQPSMVILDIMLPGMSGIEICKNIRKVSNVPIIMLTAKGESADRITGLEAGADDYVCKPFDPNELVARIKAVLRRTETVETENQMVEDEDEESPFFSLESILQEISNEREEESALEEFVYEGKSAVEQPHAAQCQIAEELQTPEEVVVSVTEKYQDNREFPQEASEESRSTGIKERLKASPKDAVIFAEILKPKYKEF